MAMDAQAHVQLPAQCHVAIIVELPAASQLELHLPMIEAV